MGGRAWAGWMHERTCLLVLILALPLAASGALPAFARFVAGADAHVCACAKTAGHSTCACPICERHADLRSRMATLRGRCGEDAPPFGAGPAPAIAPSPTLLPPLRRERPAIAHGIAVTPRDVFFTPPTPPPRTLRS